MVRIRIGALQKFYQHGNSMQFYKLENGHSVGKGAVTLWLNRYCSAYFRLQGDHAYFKEETDAIAFKLWVESRAGG